MNCRRTASFVALAACLIAAPAAAQSRRGTWVGPSTSAQGTQPFTVVLDSAASGWKGSAVAATMSDSLRLLEVSVRADTLEFGIPVNNMTVYVSGLFSGEKFSGKIWVQNNSVGTVELTRRPPADKPPPGRSE